MKSIFIVRPQAVAGKGDLSLGRAIGGAVVSIAAFWLANADWRAVVLVWVCALSLFLLTFMREGRSAFYIGLLAGLGMFVPPLAFFWRLFGPAAIALWLVLAFWMGLFVFLGARCRACYGKVGSAILIPFLWLGIEFFRSELYFLKFSWVSLGSVFSESAFSIFYPYLGVYGVGFLLLLLAGGLSLLPFKIGSVVGGGLFLLLGIFSWSGKLLKADGLRDGVRVGGIQLEFPMPMQVKEALERFIADVPDLDLVVLSEYTLEGLPPGWLRDWCRRYKKYIIVGGKRHVGGEEFYNTAFVVGPDGALVFEQAKSVPIQFFRDGLAAPGRRVWDSPWGGVGICLCYDLSFSRVTDDLVRQGAGLIVVPTMDVKEWGEREHELHAKVAPIRAAEYRVPVFRTASSGISQSVDSAGLVRVSAGFPGQGETLADVVVWSARGSLPWDRLLIWPGVGVMVWLAFGVPVFRFWSWPVRRRFGIGGFCAGVSRWRRAIWRRFWSGSRG